MLQSLWRQLNYLHFTFRVSFPSDQIDAANVLKSLSIDLLLPKIFATMLAKSHQVLQNRIVYESCFETSKKDVLYVP